MKMLKNKKSVGRRLTIALLTGLFLIVLFPSGLLAVEYTLKTIPNVRLSDHLNHVSNPDGIISTEDAAHINQILKIVEDSLGIEVAVVAVESIGDNDARMFATDLFKQWGLGKKRKDNGLLIQLVTEPVQRSVVFETGYGIEGILPDAICYRLQQRYMMPDLKKGDYSTGMLKGVAAVKEYLLASDYERATMTGGSSRQANNNSESLWMFAIVAIGMLGIIIGVSYLKYRPRICPRCGKKTFAYAGQQILQRSTYHSEGMAEDVYRCKNCQHTEKKRKTLDRLRRSGSGSGPIFMGGSGGFGGFGGGGGGSWGGGRSGGGGSISRF